MLMITDSSHAEQQLDPKGTKEDDTDRERDPKKKKPTPNNSAETVPRSCQSE